MSGIEKLMESLGLGWCILSLGTPLLTSLYVQMLAECVGLHCLGESGIVEKQGKELKDNELTHGFLRDVQLSGVFPIFCFLGPLAIPASLGFAIWATCDCAAYALTMAFEKYCIK
jgi:hypothetical protein